jgi:2-(1,2-epoxy-1,2-dihydrophenyl)acetyl-CoA isomerase
MDDRPMTDLLETIEDGVAILTFNRPERLNAFSDELVHGLMEALPRLGADSNVGCIVITGAGKAFCAGGDVKAMGSRAAIGFEERVQLVSAGGRISQLIRATPKPVIAMVNGVAVGAGLGIAAACDIRTAGESARLSARFVKVGLSGDWGGTWTLPRLIGTAKAREMYFTGAMVGAQEALKIGLVGHLFTDETLRENTLAMAKEIASMPRIALGYIKKNLIAAESSDFATICELEALHLTRCVQTEDHKEAIQAFTEKREPRFTGR